MSLSSNRRSQEDITRTSPGGPDRRLLRLAKMMTSAGDAHLAVYDKAMDSHPGEVGTETLFQQMKRDFIYTGYSVAELLLNAASILTEKRFVRRAKRTLGAQVKGEYLDQLDIGGQTASIRWWARHLVGKEAEIDQLPESSPRDPLQTS